MGEVNVGETKKKNYKKYATYSMRFKTAQR